MPYKDPAAKLAAVRRWQKANPEYERARKRKQHAALQDRTAYRARKRKWAAANPTAVRVNSARRRARIAACSVPLTPQENAKVIGLYAESRALSALMGEPYHVDHKKPLAKGGLHHPDNLQVIPARVNLRKGVIY